MSEDDFDPTEEQIRRLAEQIGAPVPKPKDPSAGERWDTIYEMLTLSPFRWRLIKTVRGETAEEEDFTEWQRASDAILALEAKGFRVAKDVGFTSAHARLASLHAMQEPPKPEPPKRGGNGPIVLEVKAIDDFGGPCSQYGRRFILTKVNEFGKRLVLLNTFDAKKAKSEVLRYQAKGWIIKEAGE